ncbi:phage virion morphogenesis protein, partial [Providencia rustigianii]|uniref:phage virion morphogenesis protein n=1 Tax=Providencia rustigianii TaxID=158850 RepID=UPI003AF32CF8
MGYSALYQRQKRQNQYRAKTKQTRMFKKLATARFLRMYNSDKEAVIYFLPSAGNIAGVHQFGLTERIG